MNPIQLFKCLSDETRLICLLLLEKEGELCVCEFTEALDESQPKVSRHLAQLRKCDLLVDRKYKQWVFYQLNPSLPDWIKKVLTLTAENNAAFLEASIERLERMGERPERAKSCC
jgi:ArsR family transcriptional regulator